MTTNITLTTLKDLKTLGRKPAKGDVITPGSMAHRYVFNALKGALRDEADRYISGEITRMTRNAQLWETLPVSTVKEAKTGVGIITENAFVADMNDHEEATNPGMDFSLEDEIGKYLAGCKTIDSGFYGDPEDGEHKVKVTAFTEKRNPNKERDDCIVISLQDVVNRNIWEHRIYLPKTGNRFENVVNFIESISMNNKGVLEFKSTFKAFEDIKTGKVQFFVWTYKRPEDGKVLTYTDKPRYDRYMYTQCRRMSDGELTQLRKKEREDNDARMQAEALLRTQNSEDTPF